MAVSYSYLYTGTSDIVPNTKYKSRLTIDVEQTGDIWAAYYGPMRSVAIHSNDRGFSYIQSSTTKKYLSRNNYGALVWWDNATPNYSDWLITDQDGFAYKTTLLNLKENQHSYLVWNKDDGSLNWWSVSAGSDTWKTYWGLTNDLPRGKYRISCNNCGVIRESRARLYYGRDSMNPVVGIYVIDEAGFDQSNPIVRYHYYDEASWDYRGGFYGDDLTFSYTYIGMNYMIKRFTSASTSYSTSFNPQNFYWVRNDGTVSYLDIMNTIDATFVGSDKCRKVCFEPESKIIPIKNAKQEGTKQVGLKIKTGGNSETTAYVSSAVYVSQSGNISVKSFEVSPFQMSTCVTSGWTPTLSYSILYDTNKRTLYSNTYYNSYLTFQFSYIGNDNNTVVKKQSVSQPVNPLYGLISPDQTVSYVRRGECTSEINLPSGLTYVSYTAPFASSYVKFQEFVETDEHLEVTTYAIQQSTTQSSYLGLNLAIGDDKTVNYPALYTFTILEQLKPLNVPIDPFKYSTYTIQGYFPHLKPETNSFIDVSLYKSDIITTNWVKKNDFKIYLNKENLFRMSLRDVIEPVIIDIPIRHLNSSISDVYDFMYDKENSLFKSATKKYNLALGSTKADLVINEEPRKIQKFVNCTNRSNVYYLGTPLFVSGTTTMGTVSKFLALTLQRYSPNSLPKYTDLRTVTGALTDFCGFFTMRFTPRETLKLTTQDQLVVKFYNQSVSADSEVFKYTVKDSCNIPYLVYYVNSRGGVDVIPLNECTIKSVSVTQSTYTKKETISVNDNNSWLANYKGSLEEEAELKTPYNIQATKAYACKTPFLDETQLTLHTELFDSMQVFLYNVTSKEFIPVVVSTNSYSIKGKKQNSGKPVQMSFNLTEATTCSKTI